MSNPNHRHRIHAQTLPPHLPWALSGSVPLEPRTALSSGTPSWQSGLPSYVEAAEGVADLLLSKYGSPSLPGRTNQGLPGAPLS